jgi:integrase
VIDLYDSFLVTEGRADKTLKKYRFALKLIAECAAKCGVQKVSQFDIRFVDRFRKARKDGELSKSRPAKPKTVFQDTVLLRQLVNFALRRKLIASDPLAGLTIKRPPMTPQPCWSQSEVDQILTLAEPLYRAPLTILARTGMRVGELMWLTWDDIDFDRKVILIRPKVGWRPKSRNQRSVPIDDELLPVLNTLPRHGRWVVNAKPTAKYPKPGRQLVDRLLLADLKRLLKKLGLPGHLHTFRHSFISDAATKGVPERVLREWIGHVDPQILAWYYKLSDPESQAAMQRLSAARRGQDPVSSSTHFQHTEVQRDN